MTSKASKAKEVARKKQRVMTIASVLFFFGSTGFTMVNLFSSIWSQPEATTTQPAEDPLKQQEQGYILVLQREPDNTAALEGLVSTRLQMNDGKGAIEPLEKLVKLHPDSTNYTTLLSQLKQHVNEPSDTTGK